MSVAASLILLLFLSSRVSPSNSTPINATAASSITQAQDQAPWLHRDDEFCLNLTASPDLEKFVDALPTMRKLHRDLPPTTLYAFGTSQSTATYPGPTLVAQQGQTAWVRWENHIPDVEPMLPLDRSLDWANPRLGGVPHVVHNHGQEDPPWSDGHPQAWFTPLGEHGPSYVSQDYVYPNEQLPTTLWYHDHTYGITRLNIAAGLVGVYLVESSALTPSWVPREYHTLLIQDKAFFADGGIKYPSVGINPSVHPVWCPDYFGDVVLVNGKAWPYLNVYPRIYRFRLVNAANSKFFVLTLSDDSLRFIKIGSDSTFLRAPISQSTMRIAPAERWDFVIDFSRVHPGRTIEMRNIGATPFPAGPPANQSVMLFRVVHEPERKNPPGSSPSNFPAPIPVENLLQMPPSRVMEETTGLKLTDSEWYRLYNRPFVTNAQFDSGMGLTGLFLQDHLHFNDPATEVMKLYSDEVWVFINVLQTSHPIHLHLVNFLIVASQTFNVTRFLENSCSFHFGYPDPRSCYTAPLQGPDQDQLGLKDTGVIAAGTVTWFYVTASPNYGTRYSFDPTASPHYIWHCHLLEHEDNEMMRPFVMSDTRALMVNESFPPVDIMRQYG
ncbi:multicopper oxidase LPR1 homolog 3-like [Selaginella moellendorffii]|uniref:multicopper oxidase LPR1 homolog 3-like n=1 Tax=Selaginella moellendorffii TaxID=88036 RepID=UPI000D1C52C3|nr:multicopper oxidase LPR1 homolog 3-like [Selaginella moellendorffii]|eukprot:XP_024519985.1 multicopper oxidase LPR1 homolog 3-like [Selaginella moellendorffii]